LVNPYGVNIVRFAQSLAASQASKLYNQDWLPLLSSRLPRETIGLRWGLVLMVLLVVMAVKEKWRERILVLASLGMALLSVRYSLLVLVGLLPMIPVVVEEMLDKVRWVAKEKRRGWLVLGILTVLVGGNMDGVKRGMCAAGSNECLAREGSFPLGAVEYLKKMGGELEIVNHYTWGGYLMWQLPRAKVFIDGRMDNFEVDGRAWIEVFADIESMRPGWEKWLEMKGGNVVLIPSDWSLGKVLVDSGEWGVGYEDKISVVLVKNEVVDD